MKIFALCSNVRVHHVPNPVDIAKLREYEYEPLSVRREERVDQMKRIDCVTWQPARGLHMHQASSRWH
jgi:hypothetical protein